MSEAIRFADLIQHEIGGGWGEETATDGSPDAAFVIRGTDIPKALVGDVSTVPYRFHKTSNLRSRTLRPLDIVFEVSGGSKGQPVGRALLVSQRLLDTLSEPAMCASFCKLIRLDPNACDPRFVFRRLQYEYASGGLDAFQVQSTGITNFRWKPFLDQFEISLPPRSDQERVAEVLGSIDDLIENNRRRVEVLEEMARAIYREWFVRFRYPGHEDVPLVDSPLGPIPDGWTVRPLIEVADITMGQSPKSEFYNSDGLGKPFHQGVTDFGRHYPTHRKFCTVDARLAQDGDILVSVRAPVGRINLADTTLVIGRGLAAVRSTAGHQSFMVATLREVFSEEDSMGGGTIFNAIRKKDLEQIPIVQPPDGLVAVADDRLAAGFRLIRSLTFASRELAAIRNLLLPKLVTGQIDVSHLDLDALTEAASV